MSKPTFNDLNLHPALVATVEKLGFATPTPIQSQAIPLVLDGRDVMGLAQTGTGKTGAFGLPLVHQLLSASDKPPVAKGVRALVLAPTRELVNQIADNLRAFVRGTPLRVQVVVGGASIGGQIRNLARGTDVLVATPGRLIDLLDRRAVRLDTASFLVLDEADQMLDMGFIHALRKIAPLVGTPRQTLLFSATMPKQMAELSKAYLTDPVRVEAAPPGKAADKVRQSIHRVAQAEKLELLKVLLAERPSALSLVFSRTKHGAERTMKKLVAAGFKAASIHGNKSQGQRDRAIGAFRKGQVRVLVATDVAARGIDIPGVTHVYNYDLPEVPENYVHRIGRTARAGADGEAIAFCAPEEKGRLRDIERLLKTKIPVAMIGGAERGEMAARPVAKPSGGQEPVAEERNSHSSANSDARHGRPGPGSGTGSGQAGRDTRRSGDTDEKSQRNRRRRNGPNAEKKPASAPRPSLEDVIGEVREHAAQEQPRAPIAPHRDGDAPLKRRRRRRRQAA